MIPIVKLQYPDTHFAFSHYIIHNVLHEAIEPGNPNLYYRMVVDGEADIWLAPLKGFMLIGVEQNWDTGERKLIIHAVAGRGLFNSETMETLYELARKEGCDKLECYTVKDGVKRLLEQNGFQTAEFDGEHYRLQTSLQTVTEGI